MDQQEREPARVRAVDRGRRENPWLSDMAASVGLIGGLWGLWGLSYSLRSETVRTILGSAHVASLRKPTKTKTPKTPKTLGRPGEGDRALATGRQAQARRGRCAPRADGTVGADPGRARPEASRATMATMECNPRFFPQGTTPRGTRDCDRPPAAKF